MDLKQEKRLLSGWLLSRLAIVAALLAGLGGAVADAQPIRGSRVVDLIRVGEEELADGRPYSALTLFEQAYDQEPDPALAYKMGLLNWELRDYRRAVTNLNRVLRRAPEGEFVDAHFYLGRAQKMQGFYGEATEAFREFVRQAPTDPRRDFAELEIAGAQMALELQEPPRIKVENAGRTVNSSNQEYSPALAGDGTLYYAGFGTNELVAEDGDDDGREIRLYTSTSRDGAGDAYAKGTPLPKVLNRAGYNTVNVALSPDGQRMLLVRAQLDGQRLLESKIFAAAKTGDTWGAAEELRNVNGDYLAKNPAFGELFGEAVIYFAADIPGGHGGFDLYYARRNGDGTYAAPVNLGKAINTRYDDVTPFYADGTLYFSTEGRPTLGGFDVFRSMWNGDSWTAPVNMGKGFNSSYDDRYFQLDRSGKRGVLTSNRPPTRSVKSKTCCDDIFLLNVEPIDIDLLVTTLDDEGNLLTGVTVELLEVVDSDTTALARKLNPKGNRFDFKLVDDNNYVIVGRREGYTSDDEEFNTVGITEPTTLQRTLVLARGTGSDGAGGPGEETIELTLNQPIRLANIYYDYDDDKILADAEPDLEYIYGIMSEYPEMKVELGSHTDARGRDAYNIDLSQRRAQSAVDWLVRRGIARDRLVAKGYGETVILNRCTNNVTCTDTEHRFNRRTEFKIIEGPTTITVRKQTRTIKTEGTGDTQGSRSGKQSVSPATRPNPAATDSPSNREQGSADAPRLRGRDTVPAAQAGRVELSEMSSLYHEPSVEGLPLLEFAGRQVEFGTVRRGETREHRYAFRNVGDAPATIALVSACECTTLDWTRGEIPVGGTGYVHAVFDSSDKSAGELITIDVILEQETPAGNGIIERLEYTFEIE